MPTWRADQNPRAGIEVAQGTEVSVTFEPPTAATVVVPDVKDLSMEAARQKSAAAHLRLKMPDAEPAPGSVAGADQDSKQLGGAPYSQ